MIIQVHGKSLFFEVCDQVESNQPALLQTLGIFGYANCRCCTILGSKQQSGWPDCADVQVYLHLLVCIQHMIWASTWQNQWLCAQWRLRSAWASAQSDQSLSLGISPVWSVSSLSAWRNTGSLATHWVHSKDSWSAWASTLEQTGQTPRLIWVFAGRTLILLVLSCHGSYQ